MRKNSVAVPMKLRLTLDTILYLQFYYCPCTELITWVSSGGFAVPLWDEKW